MFLSFIFSPSLSSTSTSFLTTQIRFMSKRMTKQATKRAPLSPKRVGKGYYKGNGCTKEGRRTSKGRFVVDPLLRLNLIVPDMTGFKLKPYIASTVSKIPPEIRRNPLGA